MAFQYPRKKKLALTWDDFEMIRYCVDRTETDMWSEVEQRKHSTLRDLLEAQEPRFEQLKESKTS